MFGVSFFDGPVDPAHIPVESPPAMEVSAHEYPREHFAKFGNLAQEESLGDMHRPVYGFVNLHTVDNPERAIVINVMEDLSANLFQILESLNRVFKNHASETPFVNDRVDLVWSTAVEDHQRALEAYKQNLASEGMNADTSQHLNIFDIAVNSVDRDRQTILRDQANGIEADQTIADAFPQATQATILQSAEPRVTELYDDIVQHDNPDVFDPSLWNATNAHDRKEFVKAAFVNSNKALFAKLKDFDPMQMIAIFQAFDNYISGNSSGNSDLPLAA